MSEGPLHRSLLIVCLLFAFAGCQATDPSTGTGPTVQPSRGGTTAVPPNDCSRGAATMNKERPVICVENAAPGLRITPDSMEAWDVLPADRTAPVMIHWVTRSGGGDLRIDFKDGGCVETPQCNGRGHCQAKTININDPQKRCRYGVTLDGVVVDPEVVITNCC
jgi:hypothetical protein